MKYAFFPGCAGKGATPELYESTLAVARALESGACGDHRLQLLWSGSDHGGRSGSGLHPHCPESDQGGADGTWRLDDHLWLLPGDIGGANKELQQDEALRNRFD